MKVLFFHADEFGFMVESPSDRIGGAEPEAVICESVTVRECLVALFHVEVGDDDRQIKRFCADVQKISARVRAERLVVAAFGHLSHSYAEPEEAMRISQKILERVRSGGCEVHTSPFGHNKTFVLHSKGHPDAVKHRSY